MNFFLTGYGFLRRTVAVLVFEALNLADRAFLVYDSRIRDCPTADGKQGQRRCASSFVIAARQRRPRLCRSACGGLLGAARSNPVNGVEAPSAAPSCPEGSDPEAKDAAPLGLRIGIRKTAGWGLAVLPNRRFPTTRDPSCCAPRRKGFPRDLRKEIRRRECAFRAPGVSRPGRRRCFSAGY